MNCSLKVASIDRGVSVKRNMTTVGVL